jgi:iron complex outermembrane receptor protein
VAATRAVRTPSRIDQDVVFDIVASTTPPLPIIFQVTGNPKLRSEKLYSYDAGYRAQLTSRLYLDLATFFNVYNDLQGYAPFTAVPSTNPPALLLVLPYANVLEGRTVGTEIAPNWDVTRGWTLRGSYSLLHWDLKDKPGYTDVGNLLSTYTGSSPSHMADIQSIVTLPKHFEFDSTYRYVNALPEYNVHTYNQIDARLAWQADKRFNLSLAAQNLLRPSHPEFGGDPGPLIGIKRSVFASLQWTP